MPRVMGLNMQKSTKRFFFPDKKESCNNNKHHRFPIVCYFCVPFLGARASWSMSLKVVAVAVVVVVVVVVVFVVRCLAATHRFLNVFFSGLWAISNLIAIRSKIAIQNLQRYSDISDQGDCDQRSDHKKIAIKVGYICHFRY